MTTLLLGLVVLTGQTYQNPVWPQDFPDPYIAQEGKDFYAYATHRDQTGFQFLHSTDLVHWERRPAVFRPSWSDGSWWAPEVHKWKSKWYLVYSAKDRTTGKHAVAIAVGDSAAGPFKEMTKLADGTNNRVGDIDATLFFDRNKPYLLYSEEEPRSIQIAQLSEDLSHTIGPSHQILAPDRPIEKGVTEAPTLVTHGGRYWLFYSSGWFQSFKRDACYQIWAAPSKSLFGPYIKPDQPLITTKPGEVYSPGHQSVFNLRSGEWWIVYHAWDNSAEPLYGQNHHGRTLRIDRLWWTPAGPKTNGPTTTPQPAPKL